MTAETRVCARCSERQPLDNYYFVSKKLGTRRGQCKACMAEIKSAQKDPAWRPACARCGVERDRVGPGRRLCQPCYDEKYDAEQRPGRTSRRLKLKPCPSCGAKRLREDHVAGTMLCPVCRAVPQSRRRRLKSLYNLTPREYVELLAAQGERCAICRRKPRKGFAVDHQHCEPMIVRGLLCTRCNTLLGSARDDAELLRAAAAFLERPTAQDLFPGRTAHPDANREYKPLRRRTR